MKKNLSVCKQGPSFPSLIWRRISRICQTSPSSSPFPPSLHSPKCLFPVNHAINIWVLTHQLICKIPIDLETLLASSNKKKKKKKRQNLINLVGDYIQWNLWGSNFFPPLVVLESYRWLWRWPHEICQNVNYQLEKSHVKKETETPKKKSKTNQTKQNKSDFHTLISIAFWNSKRWWNG